MRSNNAGNRKETNMASKDWPCRRRFTITLAGKTDDDVEDAMAEVSRLIAQGYLAGKNSNDSGGFYFESTYNVTDGELPA